MSDSFPKDEALFCNSACGDTCSYFFLHSNNCGWFRYNTVLLISSYHLCIQIGRDVVIIFCLMVDVVVFFFEDFCDSKCKIRCSKAGRQDRCLKYCGICCKECQCVPSGTYGNKDECPCYRDKKNSKGQPKCPWNLLYSFKKILLCSKQEIEA